MKLIKYIDLSNILVSIYKFANPILYLVYSQSFKHYYNFNNKLIRKNNLVCCMGLKPSTLRSSVSSMTTRPVLSLGPSVLCDQSHPLPCEWGKIQCTEPFSPSSEVSAKHVFIILVPDLRRSKIRSRSRDILTLNFRHRFAKCRLLQK